MTDKPKSNNGNNIQKPSVPDQTRGKNPSSSPQKPLAPTPPVSKPKK